MRQEAPWLDDYIWFVRSSDWIPRLWDQQPEPLESLILLGDAHSRDIASRAPPQTSTDASWLSFVDYFENWAARWRYCDNVLSDDFPYVFERDGAVYYDMCDGSEWLGDAWASVFHDLFHADKFLLMHEGLVDYGERVKLKGQICNLTAYDVSYANATSRASSEAVSFYANSMGIPISEGHLEGWIALPAGSCSSVAVEGLDIFPTLLVHSTPNDPVFEAWFSKLWAEYHIEGSTHALQRFKEEALSSAPVTTCAPVGDFYYEFADVPADSCDAKPYQEALVDSRGDVIFTFTHPGFDSNVVDEEGFVDKEKLSRALAFAQEVEALAKRYRRRQEHWAMREPRFILGAKLHDENGPFLQGVESHAMPQETILDDELYPPPWSAMLVRVNAEDIYSIEDVHSELEAHGGSPTRGIGALVELYYVESDAHGEFLASYPWRYRFNEDAWQDFDKNAALAGFEQGFFAGSEEFATITYQVGGELLTGLANFTISAATGMWNAITGEQQSVPMVLTAQDVTGAYERTQRNAYARQINEGAFDAQAGLGNIVMTTLVARVFVRGKGGGFTQRVSRRMRAGVVEGGLASLSSVGLSPPVVSTETLMSEATYGAGVGFVMGSIFGADVTPKR
jgi:hypothetical protein